MPLSEYLRRRVRAVSHIATQGEPSQSDRVGYGCVDAVCLAFVAALVGDRRALGTAGRLETALVAGLLADTRDLLLVVFLEAAVALHFGTDAPLAVGAAHTTGGPQVRRARKGQGRLKGESE